MIVAKFILLAIGSGGFGSPTPAVISEFNSELDCKAAMVNIQSAPTGLKYFCSDVSSGKRESKKKASDVETGDVVLYGQSTFKVTKVNNSTIGNLIIHGIRDGKHMNSYQVKSESLLSVIE